MYLKSDSACILLQTEKCQLFEISSGSECIQEWFIALFLIHNALCTTANSCHNIVCNDIVYTRMVYSIVSNP